ncbi:MAG: hypothetical protein Q9201_007363 [Fulgogasparrea decipioides]
MFIQRALPYLLATGILVQGTPTQTIHVNAAQVSATEGNRQVDDSVCKDYKTCGERGHRYWQWLQGNVSLVQPVDRTDGAEIFDTFYGIEFASLEDAVSQLEQDLANHGFEDEYIEAWAIFSKDPDTGEETVETAYRNMFYTYKGLIIAEENFREYDEQKKLPWSELMYQNWQVAKEWADDRRDDPHFAHLEHPGGGLISSLQTVIQAKVQNDQTKAVIQTMFKSEGREWNVLDQTWYKYTLAETSNWFYALLGTDNCKGTVWLLNDHAAEIGKKVITEIWVRYARPDPDIWMNIGPSV